MSMRFTCAGPVCNWYCVYLLVDICLSVTQDFEEACLLLKKCGAVYISQQEVTVSDTGTEVLPFLQAVLQPFIDSYQVRWLLPHLIMITNIMCSWGPGYFVGCECCEEKFTSESSWYLFESRTFPDHADTFYSKWKLETLRSVEDTEVMTSIFIQRNWGGE